MRFCSIGGFVFFLLVFLPRLEAEIVVASYNVRSYLPMERGWNAVKKPDQPKPEKEIEAVLRVLAEVKPDILGIIEMGDESQLDDFQNRLSRIGLVYPHREWVKGKNESRHVCVLSRFPIVQRNSRSEIPLKLNDQIEWMSRGILDVTVQVNPAYQLRLIGAHLKSRREVFDYDEKLKRAKEALQLRSHIHEVLMADKKTNLLLFGDLNDTKNEAPIREILGAPGSPSRLKDIYLKDSRGETWTHYWSTADSYSRIDYLMVSPGLSREIITRKSGINDLPAWREASDHRAIYTTISPIDK